MKNKKILILFIISVILIVVIGYFAIKFVKQKKSNEIQNEYVPQEEISDDGYIFKKKGNQSEQDNCTQIYEGIKAQICCDTPKISVP